MSSALELYQNLDAGQMDRMNLIQAAVTAQEMGLDPDKYARPFPASNSTRNITINNHATPKPKSGLSPLAAVGLGLLGAAIPASGMLLYLLNKAPAVVQQVEKIVEKPIEKVITTPGKSYGVDVDMEVIPPQESQ